jgi:hypothetical protein
MIRAEATRAKEKLRHALCQTDPGPMYLLHKCRGSIDLTRSFLIMWLRCVEMHNTVANIVHITVANS